MEFKEEQLIWYLNKNYQVLEGTFIVKNDGYNEWGNAIVKSLATIFSYELDFCKLVFKGWAFDNGMEEDDWDVSYSQTTLKTYFSPELHQDLQALHGINAEAELTALLSEEIAREIDAQILRDLRETFKLDSESFVPVMRCVGYEASQTVYDPDTFRPRRYFNSIKKQDRDNERQNNPYWQDWIRARRQNKET